MLATCRYTLRSAARRCASSHTRAAAEAAGSSMGASAAGAATQAGTGGGAPATAGTAWRAALQQGDMDRARGLSLPVGVLAGIFGSVAGDLLFFLASAYSTAGWSHRCSRALSRLHPNALQAQAAQRSLRLSFPSLPAASRNGGWQA